jgi:excisionase family DNA binding protein
VPITSKRPLNRAERRAAEINKQQGSEPWAFTVPQFTERMNVSRATFYRLLADGKLNAIKLGGRTLIPASEIARLLQEGAAR